MGWRLWVAGRTWAVKSRSFRGTRIVPIRLSSFLSGSEVVPMRLPSAMAVARVATDSRLSSWSEIHPRLPSARCDWNGCGRLAGAPLGVPELTDRRPCMWVDRQHELDDLSEL